jgi:hypothetical protein
MVAAVRGSFPAQVRRVIAREQEGAVWLIYPATQADADVTSARISSTEVMEVRRTRSLLRRARD